MKLREIKDLGMAQNLPVNGTPAHPASASGSSSKRRIKPARAIGNTALGFGIAALLATGIGGVSAQSADIAALSQGNAGVAGFAEAGDFFAASVATGDFNGDGNADLLVGAPLENLGSMSNAGAFHVLYGGAGGISTAGDAVVHQDTPNVGGVGEAEDLLGTSVATGDFNGDGFDDVAVGAPGENIGSLVDAGGVHVIYGSANGLTGKGDVFLHQNGTNVDDVAEAYDEFGHSVIAGDFNGDGTDDLAVGVPGEGVGSLTAAGGVHLFYGSNSGISVSNDVLLHQNSAGVAGVAEKSDMMGEALTTGDFNSDGMADLVVGAPGEGIGSRPAAGGVHVLYGSASGISTSGDLFLHQNTPGIISSAETDDMFGASLATGDFDGDGNHDLAIGAPGEDIGSLGDAGGVHILYSNATGISTSGDAFVHQDAPGVPGLAEPGDGFGMSLAAGDTNADGIAELLVGAPGEGVAGIPSAGLIHVFAGTTNGVIATSQTVHQGDANIAGEPESNNGFGSTIATGDFNGDGKADIATGAPFDTVNSVGAAGSAVVMYS